MFGRRRLIPPYGGSCCTRWNVTIQGSGAFRQQGDDCLTTTVTADRGGEIGECIQLLDLAGPGDREQPRHRALAVGAARAKIDFAPLNRRPESPLGRVIRWLDAFVLHEGEEGVALMLDISR